VETARSASWRDGRALLRGRLVFGGMRIPAGKAD
jgi:hypothetical protein